MRATCPGCGSSVQPAFNFCARCGEPLEAADARRLDKPGSLKESDKPEDPEPEPSLKNVQGDPQSWAEWRKRPFQGKWTWRDWTAIGASVVILLAAGLLTYVSGGTWEILFVIIGA